MTNNEHNGTNYLAIHTRMRPEVPDEKNDIHIQLVSETNHRNRRKHDRSQKLLDDGQIKNNMVTAMDFVASLPMSQQNNTTKHTNEEAGLLIRSNLIARKKLHFRCRQINDIMSLFAIIGLILMIVDTELRLQQTDTTGVSLIRPLIGISTGILVGLIFYYHSLNMRLYAINNHIADWRVTITIHTMLLIASEVVVCAIHPFPYNTKIISISSLSNNSGWIQMFLTLPMFARLYLIARSVTLHSPLVNAASSRTIGYLNRVPITISFILRALLQTYPAASWTCVMIVSLCIATWALRICEKAMWLPISHSSMRPTEATSTFSSAVWLTIVTFTTVGYGDVTPKTYCGQGVATITAFFGVFAGAVLIAVFTSKISLNRSEQNVLDFVHRINRARQSREKTMQIIQYSFRAWFLKRNGRRYRSMFNSLYHLHSALRKARIIKQEQRNAVNGNESLMTILSDVFDEQKSNYKSLVKLRAQCNHLEEQVRRLEAKLDTVVDLLSANNSPTIQHSLL